MHILCLAILLLMTATAAAQVSDRAGDDARTVIGPSNVDLADGAAALRTGDAEEGVRLTRRGLRSASSPRDRLAGYSNLCAGLIMLNRHEEAIESCDAAIAIDDRHWRSYSNRALANIKLKRYAEAQRDIRQGEALNPNARTLKKVRALYLDAVEPVMPSVIIDDRRQGAMDES